MSDEPSVPEQLRIRFPQLRPIKGPPALVSINGIGVSVYGRRDYDEETRTYVKTRCICFLLIPLFALDAYRVADAGTQRWYFLGKDSLSNFARGWNISVGILALLIGLGTVWDAHVNSPEYRAQAEIKRAGELMQAGQTLKAAGIYQQQLSGPAVVEARAGFAEAVQKALDSEKPEEVIGGLHLLVSVKRVGGQSAALVPDGFNKGLAQVEKFRTGNPGAALDILTAAAELDPQNPALPPLHISLLKDLLAKDPADVPHAVELAVVYDNAGQAEESLKLLRPLKNRLGATEGARILGQKLLQEQNYEDAYGLLFPYVQTNLDKLHSIELAYSNTLASISHRVVEELDGGHGPPDFYARYKAASSKEEKGTLVDDYINEQTRTDPAYNNVLATFKEANRIVPVALDLGIVQLNRAQDLKDAAARKTELEAAETTFLAIRGFAGETDEYRLFLGQVYYWLGKSTEGKALFDQLLASRKRDFPILMQIGQTLRYVGEKLEARSMAEEAYQAATVDRQRYGAAALRALLCKDTDDRVAWLQKADPTADWVQIELNQARGQKALQQGNKTLAAEYIGKAIRGYETQAKTSSSLNNWALSCFDLYEATGTVADEQKGLALMEEAIALDPSDSILLYNSTYSLMGLAARDVNHGAANISALGESPGHHLFSFLYRDEAGRAGLFRQYHDDDAMKKALGYLDKALLLAPKDHSLYRTALELEIGFRDLNEIQKLVNRFHLAAPDLTETRQETLAFYSGAKDAETVEADQKRIRELKGYLTNSVVANDPVTMDFVSVGLGESELSAWMFGENLDAVALLQGARDNYRRHPSSGSHSALRAAYFFKADQELAQQDPGFNDLMRQTRRAIPSEYRISLVLDRGGPLAEIAGKNADVLQGMALEKEDVANFSTWSGGSEWALLRKLAPDEAAVVARRIKDSEIIRTTGAFELELNPVSATLVLDNYWTKKMLGDEKAAAELYRAALAAGVPLPAL